MLAIFLIAVSHAEAAPGLPKLALIPMSSGSYYMLQNFVERDIASAPFGIVIIFLKFYFTTSMVSNFARSFIVKAAAFP
jgi:hypothetical protein